MRWTAGLNRVFALARRYFGREVLAAAVVLIVVLAGPRLVLGPKVSVETVVQHDFVQSVVASGRVETPHRADVGVQITGTVARVPVAEGQSVAAGVALIELESTELRAALKQAERAVQQALAQVRLLHEVQAPVAEQTLREAQANHDAALLTLTRNQGLLAKGFVGQAAVDEARRGEQVAQTQVRSAQRQLASARPAGSDAAVTEATLAQAQAAVEAARARLQYATVTAPLAGTLITRDVEPGDIVQPGKVLMTLSPNGETQLVVQIDEKNLQLLSVGLPALASADAYAQQRFVAELVYINPGVDAQRGSVEVKLRVPSPPTYLKQDMTVSVDIETARRGNAVLVPVDALRDADTPSPWVLKAVGGHARRQPVKIGLRSNGLCEVLDGLHAADQVIPAATVTVTDGMRIRPVAEMTRL
ncbi:MAG: efflux RND transporter periplasmic adaptor subunit [Dokdonella sp.]